MFGCKYVAICIFKEPEGVFCKCCFLFRLCFVDKSAVLLCALPKYCKHVDFNTNNV